jgi:hypothetical protein
MASQCGFGDPESAGGAVPHDFESKSLKMRVSRPKPSGKNSAITAAKQRIISEVCATR